MLRSCECDSVADLMIKAGGRQHQSLQFAISGI